MFFCLLLNQQYVRVYTTTVHRIYIKTVSGVLWSPLWTIFGFVSFEQQELSVLVIFCVMNGCAQPV